MTPLHPDQFAELFAAVNDGKSPFPWQQRLAARVAAAEPGEPAWPEVLALPTASGKTACIDVAVFALACQADRPPERRTAPRRIFFAVDRRVIVDEAYERARRLAGRLEEAGSGILRQVADRLRGLAGGDRPLDCFLLRGGVYRDDAWARTPTQPTVIATTVDQLGSRLLFRGYGRSPRWWAIHAGLAGNDSLVVLDEAHCAHPFRQTVEAVRAFRGRRWAEVPLPVPFWFVEMTATPRDDDGARRVERLEDDDRSHPVLGGRLRAAKPVRLARPIAGKTGSPRFVGALSTEAEKLAAAGARRIAVIVNRVGTARQVHARLDAAEGAKALFIGRMRPLDRDDLMQRWQRFLEATDRREDREGAVFVVATQCLEVGANLDFDAMICECASLDALRQRFGRLNRLGRDGAARGVLVVAEADTKPGSEDPIYGPALADTWRWLGEQAAGGGSETIVDFGIEPFAALWDRATAADPDLARRLSPPAPDAPVMLPAHLDGWAQTSPGPQPEPELSLFLHGRDRATPEVQLCWRADLGMDGPDLSEPEGRSRLEERWIETLTLCPPAAAECLPAPLAAVHRWLTGLDEADAGLSDVVGGAVEEADGGASTRLALRWRGPEESGLVDDPGALRPGDTLVLPLSAAERDSAAAGGAGAWSLFGHVPPRPTGALVLDLGDRAHLKARRRAVLRVHPGTGAEWPAGEARAHLLEIARSPELPARLGGAELRKELRALLTALAYEARDAGLEWLAVAARHLAAATSRELSIHLHPDGWELDPTGLPVPRRGAEGLLGGLVVSSRRRLDDELFGDEPAAETFSEDDATGRSTRPVGLEDHCRAVARRARETAADIGLSEDLRADLERAGLLHDLGKADPRFQAWLHGGNAIAARASGRLLAKSPALAESRHERERARQRAAYPRGGRHELLSVRLAESAPELLAAAGDPELVLHLVAAHHGRCRPFAPAVADDAPCEVEVTLAGHRLHARSATGLERLDSGVADRFWRLVRRYGWWGLALLETTLVLADHRQSEAEEKDAGVAGDQDREKSA